MSSEWPGTKSCKHCRDMAWNSRKHYTQLSAQKIFGLPETWEPPFLLIWIPQYHRSLIASPGVKTFGSWGLALLVPSLCHLSPSAAALGNQTVSGCAASCFEGGRHPSFHGVCDPFDGRLFLAGSFALKKFTQLKWGGGAGGVCESEIPKVNKTYPALLLGICLRPGCLWCLVAGFEGCLLFSCEKTCSQVDVEGESVYWSGNWDWHERRTASFQIAFLATALHVWCADIGVTWNVYRWVASIPSYLCCLWFPSPLCFTSVHQIWSPLTSTGGPGWKHPELGGVGGAFWWTGEGLFYLMSACYSCRSWGWLSDERRG